MDTNNESNKKNVSLGLIAEYGSDSESDDTVTRCSIKVHEEDGTELSEMVLKNNIINACAHGPLSRIADCDDDEEDDSGGGHMIIDAQTGDIGYEVTMYREDGSDSDTSSSSDNDSDIDSVKDVEEISSGEEETSHNKGKKVEAPKVNGELGLEDLPPIEDLAISLPAQQTTKIGTVASIVEQLVIVKAMPGTPAVDLDTVLFLDNGAKTLGKVFDVFGPVKEPHYAVRFNSHQHVIQRGVTAGADVYIAPANQQHTTFVFLPDLMKIRGSDASWKNDLEPPPGQVEYSDDEEERRAKREAKQKHNEGEGGENSRSTRKVPERARGRPSDGSSRFGSGPSRGRGAAGGQRRHAAHAAHGARWRLPAFGAAPAFPPFPLFARAPPPFAYQFAPRPPPPAFGAAYCSLGPRPQWLDTEPPPPPGT